MMQQRWLRICALLCIAVCLIHVEAAKLSLAVRQEDATTEDAPSTITSTPASGKEEDEATTTRESTEPSNTSVEASITEEAASATDTSSPTTAPSAINGNTPENSTEEVTRESHFLILSNS